MIQASSNTIGKVQTIWWYQRLQKMHTSYNHINQSLSMQIYTSFDGTNLTHQLRTLTCSKSRWASSNSSMHRMKIVAGLPLAKRSYSASVARHSARLAEEYFTTTTMPSGRSGIGWLANCTICSNSSIKLSSLTMYDPEASP
mmetsp:Transcript_13413/g.37747  ORF Transcript_13413/g.37747 Transcript_13413/m.37747 type:complete len:142 (+) Transcript_13413:1363-1788(+)